MDVLETWMRDHFQQLTTGSLEASARASVLCSHIDSHFHYVSTRTGPVGVNLNNNGLWRVSPAVDARVHVNYDFSCFCVDARVKLGYEFIWYSDYINSIKELEVTYAGNSADLYSSLSLQGPFLAVGVDF